MSEVDREGVEWATRTGERRMSETEVKPMREGNYDRDKYL